MTIVESVKLILIKKGSVRISKEELILFMLLFLYQYPNIGSISSSPEKLTTHTKVPKGPNNVDIQYDLEVTFQGYMNMKAIFLNGNPYF